MISVVIACTRCEYLEQAIKSIEKQTYKNIEIIIVNDNPDNTGLCEFLKKIKCNNLKIITNEVNLGLSATRNKGVDIANGEYLYFLDDDDYLNNDKAFEDMIDLIKKNNTDMCISINFSEKQIGDNVGKIDFQEYYGKMENDNILRPVSNKIYIKQYFIKNNLYYLEGYTAEEDEQLYRMLICNPKVSIYSKRVYFYRRDTPNSIMKTTKYMQDKCYINMISKSIIENGNLDGIIKCKALMNIHNSTRSTSGIVCGMF